LQLPAPTASTPAGKAKPQSKEKPTLIQAMTAKTAAPPPANPEPDLLRQAQERLTSQDYPAAFALLRESLLAEKSAEAYIQIVSCLKTMGNDTLAQAYLEEGLEHFPENEALLKNKLITLLRNREYNKALPLTDSLLLRRPQDSTLYTYRGVCQYHLQNLPQALAEFQTSLQIDPAGGENYYYIGLILDTRRQYLLALENYRHFLRQLPPASQRKQWEWTASRVKTLENALAGQK
jgi:tetratricopeptide (TPR) repeat protein